MPSRPWRLSSHEKKKGGNKKKINGIRWQPVGGWKRGASINFSKNIPQNQTSCVEKIFIDLFYDHVALSHIFYDYNFDLNRMSPRRSSSSLTALSILEIQDSFLWCIFMALPSFTKSESENMYEMMRERQWITEKKEEQKWR